MLSSIRGMRHCCVSGRQNSRCMSYYVIRQRQIAAPLATTSYSAATKDMASSSPSLPTFWKAKWNFTNIIALSQTSARQFCALTKDEEENERQRVSELTPYEREMELRKLDEDIKLLNTYRSINNGEHYTWKGKSKALALNYGFGFVLWYGTVWSTMFVSTFLGIKYGGVDALALIAKTDVYTGLDLAKRVDPTLGAGVVTYAFNEMMEPVRMVFVVLTTKSVVNAFRK